MAVCLDTPAHAPPADRGPGRGLVSACRAWLTWPRLPAAVEVVTSGAGYAAHSLARLALRAGHHAAFAHAALLWQAERQVHLTVEPSSRYTRAEYGTRSYVAESYGPTP